VIYEVLAIEGQRTPLGNELATASRARSLLHVGSGRAAFEADTSQSCRLRDGGALICYLGAGRPLFQLSSSFE
jgi:hypothetical protein